jgi:hypothetical protein
MTKSLVLALFCISVASAASADDHYWHTHVSEQRDFSRDSAGTVSAPEIDPASALSGLTLLVGGIAVIRGRRK